MTEQVLVGLSRDRLAPKEPNERAAGEMYSAVGNREGMQLVWELPPAVKAAREAEHVENEAAQVVVDRAARRKARDGLLRGSDWTQLGDVPLSPSDKITWAFYRQELRDMDFTDPKAVVWPTPPGG